MSGAMHRQRPNMPALIGAVVCVLCGILSIAGIQVQRDYVPGSPAIRMLILLTIILPSILLIIAFSRYRFTHLGKKPDATHTDKHHHHHRRPGH